MSARLTSTADGFQSQINAIQVRDFYDSYQGDPANISKKFIRKKSRLSTIELRCSMRKSLRVRKLL